MAHPGQAMSLTVVGSRGLPFPLLGMLQQRVALYSLGDAAAAGCPFLSWGCCSTLSSIGRLSRDSTPTCGFERKHTLHPLHLRWAESPIANRQSLVLSERNPLSQAILREPPDVGLAPTALWRFPPLPHCSGGPSPQATELPSPPSPIPLPPTPP